MIIYLTLVNYFRNEMNNIQVNQFLNIEIFIFIQYVMYSLQYFVVCSIAHVRRLFWSLKIFIIIETRFISPFGKLRLGSFCVSLFWLILYRFQGSLWFLNQSLPKYPTLAHSLQIQSVLYYAVCKKLTYFIIKLFSCYVSVSFVDLTL